MGGLDIGLGAAEAASALQWWLEAGVDVVVEDVPRNWLLPDQQSGAAVDSPDAEAVEGRSEDSIPETLDLFRDWLATSPSLPLASASAARIAPKGGPDAPVMLLADSPSGEESATGEPIAGDAWALMTKMLEAVGIDPEAAYLANISCFHAPGRRMTAGELESCGAIARRHIALAKPKRLLLLGDGPARALFGKSLAASRGHAHKIEGVRSVVTFHPRFLLDRPSEKARAWQDLLLLTEDTP